MAVAFKFKICSNTTFLTLGSVMVDCAVPTLMVIFNRPDKTKKVFEAVRQAKPRQLFVFADGPREHNPQDIETCDETRQIINVDWDCQVHLKISDKNLGCKLGVYSAVSWFFSLVEEGIILEDDCVPHPDFFKFCEELLDRYRNDTRIFGISGNNFTENRPLNSSYYFLKTTHIWGWASWRRSWNLFDLLASDWPTLKKSEKISTFLKKEDTRNYWEYLIDNLYSTHGTSWSGGIIYAMVKHDMLGISPKYNLVSNIGFGNSGTHPSSEEHPYANMPSYPLEFPLVHPQQVALSVDFDNYVEEVWNEGVNILHEASIPTPPIQDLVEEVRAEGMNTLHETSVLTPPIQDLKEYHSPDPQSQFHFKRHIKSIARALFYASKPIVRPIAARIRHYFAEPLANEIKNLQTQFVEPLAKEIQNLQVQMEKLQRQAVVYGGNGETLIRTHVGHVLCASNDYGPIANLTKNGESEPGVRSVIEKLLKPGDTFIDVGANLGLHTLAAARAMRGQGSIIAFEPFEPTKRLLEKTVWINGYSDIVQIHQTAVGKNGSRTLFLGPASGHHSLFPLSSISSAPTAQVSCITLDSVIPNNSRINLIKIDVEGAELEVLEGAESIIKQNPEIAIIAEYGCSHIRRSGRTEKDWFSQFERLGLTWRVINAETGALENWSLEELNSILVNLLFARPNSYIWQNLKTS